MKKFTFSLQAVLKTKRVFKKQKQAEYAAAVAELEKLLDLKRRFEEELEKCGEAYNGAVEVKITVSQLTWYDHYSQFIRESISQMDKPIQTAREKVETLREQLVSLVRETDTLEKLEEEQYQAYLKEVAKDEEKVLEDLMSYESAAKSDEQTLVPA